MLLTEMNLDDLDRLKQFRLERLAYFFSSILLHCHIQVDAENTLSVYCSHPRIIDDLLDDLEDFCKQAWLILGVRTITLYFAQEEILRIDTYSYSSTEK